jgi:hypothetical protein
MKARKVLWTQRIDENLLRQLRDEKKRTGVSIALILDVAIRKHLKNLKGERNKTPF